VTEFEALCLSAAIEAPVAYATVRFARWPCRGPLYAAAASALATALTHPLLWALALWAYDRMPAWQALLGLEALVVLAEAVPIAWIARLRWRQAILVSLLANAASFLSGLLITG
jgi:hypothetical protein